MRHYLLGLGLLFLTGGCRTECITNLNYPVCEYRFEKNQTYLYDFNQVSTESEVLNIGSDARLKLSGDTYLGDQWTLSQQGDQLFVGLPRLSRVLEFSLAELLSCPDNLEWALVDRNLGNVPPNIQILPRNDACDVQPNIRQYTGTGRFGSTLLSVETADGSPQLWVGSPRADGRRGRVTVFDAPYSDVPEATVHWDGPDAGDEWGHTLVSCGDVSGDGTNDVIMASHTAYGQRGALQLIDGGVSYGEAAEQTALEDDSDIWIGAASGDHAGTSIWCAGDLTGDAYADILVGAPFDNSCGGDASITNCGVVYLIEGGPNRPESGTLSDQALRVLRGPNANGFCGQTLTAADFDVDGHIDLAIGCPGTNAGKGGALLYSGNSLAQTFSTPAGFLDGRGYPNTNASLITKDHFGLSMVTSDLQRLGRPGIFMGSPTVTSPTGSIHAGALEFWSGRSVAGVLAGRDPAQPNIRVQGVAPFHSVGQTIFWGDYLFVTTRED